MMKKLKLRKEVDKTVLKKIVKRAEKENKSDVLFLVKAYKQDRQIVGWLKQRLIDKNSYILFLGKKNQQLISKLKGVSNGKR